MLTRRGRWALRVFAVACIVAASLVGLYADRLGIVGWWVR